MNGPRSFHLFRCRQVHHLQTCQAYFLPGPAVLLRHHLSHRQNRRKQQNRRKRFMTPLRTSVSRSRKNLNLQPSTTLSHPPKNTRHRTALMEPTPVRITLFRKARRQNTAQRSAQSTVQNTVQRTARNTARNRSPKSIRQRSSRNRPPLTLKHRWTIPPRQSRRSNNRWSLI